MRYRSNRLTLHIDSGTATPVWVYIDYRVNPGVSRPGCLECRIDGAAY